MPPGCGAGCAFEPVGRHLGHRAVAADDQNLERTQGGAETPWHHIVRPAPLPPRGDHQEGDQSLPVCRREMALDGYVTKLKEEGYDTAEQFRTLTLVELKDDINFKPGCVIFHVDFAFPLFNVSRFAQSPQAGGEVPGPERAMM